MRKIFLSVLVLLCFSFQAKLFAETDYQVWQAFFQQGRISKKAGYWLDGNYRTRKNFLQSFSLAIVRVGATYYVKDNIRLTAGYAFATQFLSPDGPLFNRNEHRPWQMLLYSYTHKPWRFQTAFRIEERFIQKSKGEKVLAGYEFRNRLRLAAFVFYQLNKEKLVIGNVSVFLNPEVMFNAYSTDKAKPFDQNRIFAGFNFQVTETFQFLVGYMHTYVSTSTGYDHIHTARINFIHTPDFRKKKKED